MSHRHELADIRSALSATAGLGCDHWTGGGYCGDLAAPYTDEVTGQRFCVAHAGPLVQLEGRAA